MTQEQLDFLTQQKIELMLQMKMRKFDEEINALKQQVITLHQTIAQLRTELSGRTIKTSSEPEREPVRQVQVSAQTAPPEKKEPHPRQGDYTPNDVSIEKYFNFSRK